MKHSFLFACLLFCLAGLLPDPAAGADPVPVEKTESVPEPEEIMVGETPCVRYSASFDPRGLMLLVK